MPDIEIHLPDVDQLTKDDVNRTFKVSAWFKSDIDTAVKLGMSSTGSNKNSSGGSIISPSYHNAFYNVAPNAVKTVEIKAGDWQKAEYEITVVDAMLQSYYTYENKQHPALFTMQFDVTGGFPTVHIDDIYVVETNVGTGGTESETYYNLIDFDSFDTLPTDAIGATALQGNNYPSDKTDFTKYILDDTVDRTNESGKSLKITSKRTGGATLIKFKQLFGSSFTYAKR